MTSHTFHTKHMGTGSAARLGVMAARRRSSININKGVGAKVVEAAANPAR
jgi:hypothetical protein